MMRIAPAPAPSRNNSRRATKARKTVSEKSGLVLISWRNVARSVASTRPDFDARAVRYVRCPVSRFNSPRNRPGPCLATTSLSPSCRTISTSPSRTTKKAGTSSPASYRTSPDAIERTSPNGRNSSIVAGSSVTAAGPSPSVSRIGGLPSGVRASLIGRHHRGGACSFPSLRAPAVGHPPADALDARQVPDDALPRALRLRAETLDRLDAPVTKDHRNKNLVVVQRKVVDARRRDRGRVRAEIGNPCTGHLEGAHLAFDRAHGAGRIDLQGRGHEVAIEEIVEVLVGRDPRHHLVAGLVVEEVPGVAVRDTRRQLLQRDVRERVDGGIGLRHLPAAHLVHPRAFERFQIDRVRDRDVVADHDPVAQPLRYP